MAAPFRGFFIGCNIVSSLIVIPFILIFVAIGLSVAMGGIMNYQTLRAFDYTPIGSLDNLEVNKIVKLYITPESNAIVKSSVSETPCVYYNTQDVTYYSDEGSIYPRVKKEVFAPAELTFKKNNVNYVLSLEKPKPTISTKIKKIFLLDTRTNKYLPTNTTDYSSGDKTLEENIITKNEPVLVFGQLLEIQNLENNSKRLIFYNTDVGNPFTGDQEVWAKKFVQSILDNRPTLYIVSTKSPDEIKNKYSYTMCYFMIGFGAIFALIPGSMLISMLYSFMKTIYKGANTI